MKKLYSPIPIEQAVKELKRPTRLDKIMSIIHLINKDDAFRLYELKAIQEEGRECWQIKVFINLDDDK